MLLERSAKGPTSRRPDDLRSERRGSQQWDAKGLSGASARGLSSRTLGALEIKRQVSTLGALRSKRYRLLGASAGGVSSRRLGVLWSKC